MSSAHAAIPGPASAPDRAVWVGGRLLRGSEAVVPFFDRGAHDGEGLFETLRVYGGRTFRWDHHLERLVIGAAELGFPVAPAPALLLAALAEVLAANRLADAAARLTMTRGAPGRRPTRAGVWVEAEPLSARLWEGTRRLAARAVFSRRPFSPGPLGAYKTTSRLAYHLAKEEARAARADEAILVDPGGRVLEGAASNLFVVTAGRLATPPLELGILPGITRSVVLDLARELGLTAEERVLSTAEILSADEVFLTNSIQEIVPLEALEDRSFRGRETGLRLARAYREAVEREAGLLHP